MLSELAVIMPARHIGAGRFSVNVNKIVLSLYLEIDRKHDVG